MRSADAGPLVGVVVPMYNAEATIAETLESICRQTYSFLDIVVVDDGSADRSCAIVSSLARGDERIRLVHQVNAGVAEARNRGAAETKADYLAFVDSDDLGAPEKFALQMELLAGSGPALVYCWFTHIDSRSRAFPITYEYPPIEGNVRQQLARENFVGNGSSMLVPREVFDCVGGFDPSLRARSAQGCEENLFVMAAAQYYPVRVVPRRLVGYRTTAQNMSSDAEQMLRSYDLVVERFGPELPEFAQEFRDHHRDFILWNAKRAVMGGRLHQARQLLRRLEGEHGVRSYTLVAELAWLYLKAKAFPRWAKTLASHLGILSRPKYQTVAW
jgi:glycosyltransferase involved in cell wall biosynthesis